MVVITTSFSPDLREACLSNTLKVDHAHLLAVKRCYESGKLMKTHGKPIDSSSEVDGEGSMLSTYNVTMVCCWFLFFFRIVICTVFCSMEIYCFLMYTLHFCARMEVVVHLLTMMGTLLG